MTALVGLAAIRSWASVGSIDSVASVGSILSVNSVGSVLSIGSAGSILCSCSDGRILHRQGERMTTPQVLRHVATVSAAGLGTGIVVVTIVRVVRRWTA